LCAVLLLQRIAVWLAHIASSLQNAYSGEVRRRSRVRRLHGPMSSQTAIGKFSGSEETTQLRAEDRRSIEEIARNGPGGAAGATPPSKVQVRTGIAKVSVSDSAVFPDAQPPLMDSNKSVGASERDEFLRAAWRVMVATDFNPASKLTPRSRGSCRESRSAPERRWSRRWREHSVRLGPGMPWLLRELRSPRTRTTAMPDALGA
jgi:hypothetical protein